MAVDVDRIRTRYPIFSPLDDEQIEEFINDALAVVPVDRFGVHADRAVCCYTAHLLLINYRVQLNLGGGMKTLQDETGRAIELYKSGDEWLNLTDYGREFIEIRDSLIPVIGFNVY